MSLEYINTKTCPSIRRRKESKPIMSITHDGRFSFNRESQLKLKFKHHDKVSIAYDKQTPEKIYLFLDEKHGALISHFTKNNAMSFSSVAMKNRLYEKIGWDKETKQFFEINTSQYLYKIFYYIEFIHKQQFKNNLKN